MLANIQNILSSDSLKGKFARGGIVLSASSAFEIGIRFIRNIILTRVLAPEYFGLMATIMSAIAVSEAFTEVGIRQAVIQNKKGDTAEFLNAAWCFSCLRGACLYVIALLVAPIICDFFNTPEILLPMRISFSALFFRGLISPRMYLLEKELNYFKLIIIRQGSALLQVLISIVLSIYYKNVWPLVIGLTIENFCIFLFSFIFLPFRPKVKVDRSSFNKIFKFASGMFGLPILASVFFQFDIFVIGKLLTMEKLGLYAMAKTFALVPVVAFTKTVSSLVLPVFSKLQDSQASLKGWFLKITDLTALICMPGIAFCVIISKPLLSVIYGPMYGSVSTTFSILMLYVMIRLLSAIIMQLFLALARPDLQRCFAFIRVLLILILAYPATKKFGLVGASSTVLLGMLSLFILQIVWALKLINMKAVDYIMCLIRGLLISSLVILPGLVVRMIFQNSETVMIVAGILLCFISWVIALNTQHYKMIILGKYH